MTTLGDDGGQTIEHAGCTELCVENITVVTAVVVDGHIHA
jgi:hypothetical protein